MNISRRIYCFRHVLPICVRKFPLHNLPTVRCFKSGSHTSTKKIKKLLTVSVLAFFWPLKTQTSNIKTDTENIIQSKQSLVEEADELFQNGHFRESYKLLCKIEDTDIEIIWRKCRALYNMAESLACDNERMRKRYIEKAYTLIEMAMLSNGDHYAVHKWYALLLDAKGSYEGIKQRIRQLETVKHHMIVAASLNPKDATTLYMLGEWCYQICDMPWYQRQVASAIFARPPESSYKEALEYFLKAEAAEPRFYSLNLLMIGKTYMKMHMDDQAKYYLKLAASYPAKSNDDHKANKEAAALLRKLK